MWNVNVATEDQVLKISQKLRLESIFTKLRFWLADFSVSDTEVYFKIPVEPGARLVVHSRRITKQPKVGEPNLVLVHFEYQKTTASRRYDFGTEYCQDWQTGLLQIIEARYHSWLRGSEI